MDQDAMRNLILLTAGVVGWYFLYQRTRTADQSKKAAEQGAEATIRSAETAEKGLTAERLTRSIEQIAHEDSFVRLGGILGLEQIADVHEDERYKIARVLVSFIRNKAPINSEENNLETEDDFATYREQRLDIEAAIRALVKIVSDMEQRGEIQRQRTDICDLRNTDLRGLELYHMDLSHFNLEKTDFSGAWLAGSDFTGARLERSKFILAQLHKPRLAEAIFSAKFIGANLNYADFSGVIANYADFSHIDTIETKFIDAYLNRAVFVGVTMSSPEFNNAILVGTIFIGADMNEVKMHEAKLKNVNLTSARLLQVHGLTQPQLDQAFCWEGCDTIIISPDEDELNPLEIQKTERPAETEFCMTENGDRWLVYKDCVDNWRWWKSSPSGVSLGKGSREGYTDKAGCVSDARQNGMDCEPS